MVMYDFLVTYDSKMFVGNLPLTTIKSFDHSFMTSFFLVFGRHIFFRTSFFCFWTSFFISDVIFLVLDVIILVSDVIILG